MSRQAASHQQWAGEWGGQRRIVTLDVKYREIGDPRLLKSIIRQAGMTREEFYCSTERTARKINQRPQA